MLVDAKSQGDNMHDRETIETPFQTLGQALAYINEKNPARAKYHSRIEPETATRIIVDDFTGKSPKDIFASAIAAVTSVLAEYPFVRSWAWGKRNLGPRSEQWAIEEIAIKCGKHKSRIYRWLDRIDEDMEREFKRRYLIPS